MAYKKDVVRLTVAVSQDLNHKLEVLSDRMHISKTALVIQMLETNIDMLSQTWSMISDPSLMAKLNVFGSKVKGIDENLDRSIDEFNSTKLTEDIEKVKDTMPKELIDILTKK